MGFQIRAGVLTGGQFGSFLFHIKVLICLVELGLYKQDILVNVSECEAICINMANKKGDHKVSLLGLLLIQSKCCIRNHQYRFPLMKDFLVALLLIRQCYLPFLELGVHIDEFAPGSLVFFFFLLVRLGNRQNK